MILVTGATGNVGAEVVRLLSEQGTHPFRPASRSEFDFERPETFPSALRGVSRIFLVRPPHLSDAKKYFLPLIETSKATGVRQIVFLSLLGAEKNSVVPHRAIEDLILASGIPYTFLRASFFMQNLSTTHAPEIRELDEIIVPAGNGKTSFIDVRDIAAVAVKALTEPSHENRAYPLTGSESLTYGEIAEILSSVLGRRITYRRPSIFRFIRRMRKRGFPWPFIGVMIGIYTVARLGRAGTVTEDTRTILGRAPISFRQFALDHQAGWKK